MSLGERPAVLFAHPRAVVQTCSDAHPESGLTFSNIFVAQEDAESLLGPCW